MRIYLFLICFMLSFSNSIGQNVNGYWAVNADVNLQLINSGQYILTKLNHDIIDSFRFEKASLFQSVKNKKLFLQVINQDTVAIFNVNSSKMNVLTKRVEKEISKSPIDNLDPVSIINTKEKKQILDLSSIKDEEISVYSSIGIDEQESPLRLGFLYGNPEDINLGGYELSAEHPKYISAVTGWADDPVEHKGVKCSKISFETPSYSDFNLKSNNCLICGNGETYISIENSTFKPMGHVNNPMEFFGLAFAELTGLKKASGYFIDKKYTSFTNDKWGNETPSSSSKSYSVGDEVYWTENETYRTGSSGSVLGDIFIGDLYNSTYKVQYVGVVEALIGNKLKVIIQDIGMEDPKWASYNYIKAKSAVLSQVSNNVGKTRVLDSSAVTPY